MNKKLPMSEIVPLIMEVVAADGRFTLYPKGTSMLPLIVQGRDFVVLGAVNAIDINDILLYRRKNGQYVLHRVINISNGELLMCGDNQFVIEKGIDSDMVIAKVVSLNIDGQAVELSDEKYKSYVKTLSFRRKKKKATYYFKRVPFHIRRIIKGEKKD